MTTDPFDAALSEIDSATDPTVLFGTPTDDETIPPTATATYRRLARSVHPDTAPKGRRTEADAGFGRPSQAWNRYQETVRGGPWPDDLILPTADRTYHVDRGRPLAEGDIADPRAVRHRENGRWLPGVLELPRAPRDNDLIRAEAAALRRIDERGLERYRAFAPRLVGTIRHRDPKTLVERNGNVLDRLTGFHDLTAVRRAYPEGIDPRDAAWMWRRPLVAIGNAHQAGVLHGAAVPEHVLIHPAEHGLVLVDWCYSVIFTEPGSASHVPAMVPHRADTYPPEVTERRPATPAVDVYMATRCVEYLTAGPLPLLPRCPDQGLLGGAPGPERPVPGRPGRGLRDHRRHRRIG